MVKQKGLDFDKDVAKFTDRQMQANAAIDSFKYKFILYGGALGGGKSYWLRWVLVRLLFCWYKEKGLKNVVVMLACEDYPQLKDRQLSKIAREFPPWLGKQYSDHKDYGRCFILSPEFGSGVICFRNLDDASKYQCFHPDTELLTKYGWRKVEDVKVEDCVASLDPNTREVSYEDVFKVWSYEYDGLMEYVCSRGTPAFCVTPNHTIWASTSRCNKLKPYRADKLPRTAKIPQCAEWVKPLFDDCPEEIEFNSSGNNGRSVKFSIDDWMEFLGWYIGDGSLDPAPRFAIRISQVNKSGREKIISLLNRSGINYHVQEREINFNNKALYEYLVKLGKSHDKYIPRDIMLNYDSKRLYKLLWSLVEADGTWVNKNNGHFVTASKQLADDVSEVAIFCGFRPTIDLRYDKEGQNPYGDGHKPRYHVHLLKKITDTACGKHRKQIPYKGKVYCVTVPPYHTVLTRYKGRVSWSGQSAEFAAAAIDEITKNNYDTFTEIRKRLRWPGLTDDECLLLGATNPGGVGHAYCKALWIDKTYPEEFLQPYDYSKKFCYIPAKADDNPHLDEGYWRMLNTLPAHQRAAFRDGSWDTYIGQFFQEWSRVHHVINPIPVPPNAPLFMTFDWGFGAPFSVGWWWVDSDGRFYRFNEWYGWNGTPNQGLRLADSEIGQGIIKREQAMGLNVESNGVVNPQIIRLCDPTCFNKKPDYKGGGQGTSTAEEFRRLGLILRPGDPTRALKWRQFHQRLLVTPDDKGGFLQPMMQVYSNCTHFIRTIPNIVVNSNNIEDIDTDGEDHIADEAALLCMARPLQLAGSRKWDEILNEKPQTRPKDISEVAQRERENIFNQLNEDITFMELY